jgi:hypothetical protein
MLDGISDILNDSASFVQTADGVIRGSLGMRRAIADAKAARSIILQNGDDLDRLRRLLRVDLNSETIFRLSDSHPIYANGQVPAADVAAFSCLVDPAFAVQYGDPSMYLEDDPELDAECDLILFGSPESETLTRALLGYKHDTSGVLTYVETVPLAYRWLEDPSKVSVYCLQHRPGGAIAVRPNWPLVATSPEFREYPKLRNGWLDEDYLVITRVPNFVSDRARQAGRAILSIAGLHGIATRSIGLALADEAIVQDLLDLVSRHPWFQVVIKVTAISHGDTNTGSLPTRVELYRTCALDLSEQVLESASKKFAALLIGESSSPILPRNRSYGFEIDPPFTPEKRAQISLLERLGRFSD